MFFIILCKEEATSQTISIFPRFYTANIGQSLQITCIATGIGATDLIWEYYPTRSTNQSPLTTIYIDKDYKTNPSMRFLVSNVISYGSLISTLTLVHVLDTDNELTFKCECNKYSGCSSFGSNNPYATATIVAIGSN